MRILFIGDIVGKPGRHICTQAMRGLRTEENLDLVVANAENVAGGSGLTPEIYHELIAAGIDGITMGDHVYRRREIFPILQTDRRIVRPANYPAAPRATISPSCERGNRSPWRSSPFSAGCSCRRSIVPSRPPTGCLAALPSDVRVILVDFHAEATSDKQLMGRHLDGRVSAVLGTHTHVATADEQILPGGTAFQCDVGMTGPHESILGRRIDRVMETTRTFRPYPFRGSHGRRASQRRDCGRRSAHRPGDRNPPHLASIKPRPGGWEATAGRAKGENTGRKASPPQPIERIGVAPAIVACSFCPP